MRKRTAESRIAFENNTKNDRRACLSGTVFALHKEKYGKIYVGILTDNLKTTLKNSLILRCRAEFQKTSGSFYSLKNSRCLPIYCGLFL